MKFAVDVLTQKVAQLGGFRADTPKGSARDAEFRKRIAELNAAIAVLERAGARAEKTANKLRPRTGAVARHAVNRTGENEGAIE